MDILERIRAGFLTGGPFGTDLDAERAADAFVASMASVVSDDFTCTMNGGALTTTYVGLEGLRAGWRDFLEAFETIAIEPEDYFESPAGDAVAEFVRLTGQPKGTEVRIEEAGGAVWRVAGGRLVTVEFHLDRAAALRSAGIEPG